MFNTGNVFFQNPKRQLWMREDGQQSESETLGHKKTTLIIINLLDSRQSESD
jgi:hypothetical protein